jgi:type VI secretion system protein ImpB
MSTSYQHEIPKARINITLDVETHGAKKKMELPMRLLVMAKFSDAGNQPNVELREKISINKNNFNDVLKELSPTANFTVPSHLRPDQTDLRIKLQFKHILDFHPDHLTTQIPELRRLVAMRNLLKELKANITDNKILRKELEDILHQPASLENLRQRLCSNQGNPHE